MPVMDGFELVRVVQAARPGLPVILVTGRPDLLNRSPLDWPGHYRLFKKPFDGQELLTAVGDALRSLTCAHPVVTTTSIGTRHEHATIARSGFWRTLSPTRVQRRIIRASRASTLLRTLAPMLKTAAIVPEEQELILSTLSPGPAQKRLALAVVLGILVVFVLITAGPLSSLSTTPGRRLRPGVCDGDVRVRFDHRDPPVRPVFHSALARHPRDREWISLHGAHSDSLDPDVSRRVCAKGPDWRSAEHVMALLFPARRLSSVRHRLCLVEGCGSRQTNLAGHDACGDRPERRLDGGPGFGVGVSLHRGRSAACRAWCSIPSISARCGPMSGRPSRC